MDIVTREMKIDLLSLRAIRYNFLKVHKGLEKLDRTAENYRLVDDMRLAHDKMGIMLHCMFGTRDWKQDETN